MDNDLKNDEITITSTNDEDLMNQSVLNQLDTLTLGNLTNVTVPYFNTGNISFTTPNQSMYYGPQGVSGLTIGTSYGAILGATSPNNTIQVTGENADIVINGKSLKTFMEKMEDRLAILQPDPAKLEKYEALKKAYNHYKLMEKLVQED